MLANIIFLFLGFMAGNILNVCISWLLQDIVLEEIAQSPSENKMSFVTDYICSLLTIESRKGKGFIFTKSDWLVIYTTFVFYISYSIYGINAHAFKIIALFVFIYITSEIDISYLFICDEIIVFFSTFAIFISFFIKDSSLLSHVISAIIGFSFYFLIYRIVKRIYKEELFGLGDVFFMGALGFYLLPKQIFMASVGSFIVALIISVMAYIIQKMFGKKKDETKDSFFDLQLPFAPFIGISTFITVVWGDTLLQLYMGYLLR